MAHSSIFKLTIRFQLNCISCRLWCFLFFAASYCLPCWPGSLQSQPTCSNYCPEWSDWWKSRHWGKTHVLRLHSARCTAVHVKKNCCEFYNTYNVSPLSFLLQWEMWNMLECFRWHIMASHIQSALNRCCQLTSCKYILTSLVSR